jgi:outer membrane protein
MEYAIAHSAKMEIQRANNDDARIARREAILRAFTPTIQGGTYASLNFGRGIDPETNNYISTTSFNNGYSLSGAITLFNGFAAVNNLKITKTAIKMGITEEQQLRDQICLAVMEAYCNVLYFTQMTEALQVQVATATSNLQLAQRQEQLGQKSHADVIQLEADLAEREYQYITMTNQLNDARMTLQYEGILSTRQEPVMNP